MKKFLVAISALVLTAFSSAFAGDGAGQPSAPLPVAPSGIKITALPQRDTDVGLVNTMQVIDGKCTMVVQSAPAYKLDPYVHYEPANPQHKNVWLQVKKDGLECVVREAIANLDQSYDLKSVRLIRPDVAPAYWVLGNPTNPCSGIVVGNRQNGGEVGRWTKGNTLGQGTSTDNFNDMIALASRSNIALTSPRCQAYLRGFLGKPLQGPMGPAGQNGTNGTNGTNGRDGIDGQNGIRGNFVFSGTVLPTLLYPARSEDLLVGDQYIQTLTDRLVYYRWDGKAWVPFFTLTQARDGIDGAPGNTGAKGDKGDTGATGAQGPQGPAGVQGVAGTNGTNGTDGLSAAVRLTPATKDECPNGGTVIEVSVDSNKNGVPDATDAQYDRSVSCNGVTTTTVVSTPQAPSDQPSTPATTGPKCSVNNTAICDCLSTLSPAAINLANNEKLLYNNQVVNGGAQRPVIVVGSQWYKGDDAVRFINDAAHPWSPTNMWGIIQVGASKGKFVHVVVTGNTVTMTVE